MARVTPWIDAINHRRLSPPACFTAGFWLISAALAGLCSLSAPASAQDTVTTDARAQVFDDVTLAKIRDMDFGSLIVPNSGRIDMTATDTANCTPNNAIEVLDTCQSAAFTGTAGAGFQLRVSVPAGRRINLSGPGQNLRLRRMNVGAGNGLTLIQRVNRHFDFTVTDANGDFEFFVGGRLLFRNNQTPGVYSGTFTIEVDYQ